MKTEKNIFLLKNSKMGETPDSIEDFVSKNEEEKIVNFLDEADWTKIKGKKTIIYGQRYSESQDKFVKAKDIPSQLKFLVERLVEDDIMKKPDQITINSYEGQKGDTPEQDSEQYGPVVAQLSLNANGNIHFEKGKKEINIFVPRRTLVIIEGKLRNEWEYDVPAGKTYVGADGKNLRKKDDYRRLTLTFKTISKVLSPRKDPSPERKSIKMISPKTQEKEKITPGPTSTGRSILKKVESPERREVPSSPRKNNGQLLIKSVGDKNYHHFYALVENKDISVEDKNEALLRAVKSGNHTFADNLMKYGADIRSLPSSLIKSASAESSEMKAVLNEWMQGGPKPSKHGLSIPAEPDYETLWKEEFSTRVPKDNIKEVYLRAQQKIKGADYPDQTLKIAAYNGWDRMVKKLLPLASDGAVEDAIYSAIDANDEDMLRLLLSSDRVREDKFYLYSGLAHAYKSGNPLTEVFIEYGIDLENIPNDFGGDIKALIKGYKADRAGKLRSERPVSPRKERPSSPRREVGLLAEKQGTPEKLPSSEKERPTSPRKETPEDRFANLWRAEFSMALPSGSIKDAYMEGLQLMKPKDENLKLALAAQKGWEMRVIDLLPKADLSGKLSALNSAMKGNRPMIFKMILKDGNIPSTELAQILANAVEQQKPEFVRILLEAGARLDETKYEVAISPEMRDILNEFVGGVREVPMDPEKRAIFMMKAIADKDQDYLEELVVDNKEADQPISQEKLNEGLILAVDLNFVSGAETLLENGAKIDVISKSQKFPDQMAIVLSHWRAKLPDISASPNLEKKIEEARTEQEVEEEEVEIEQMKTALAKIPPYEKVNMLRKAVEKNDRVKFYALIRDPDIDKYSLTNSLEDAIKQNNDEFADVLLDTGADINDRIIKDAMKSASGKTKKVIDFWLEEEGKRRERPLTIAEIEKMSGYEVKYGGDGWESRYSEIVDPPGKGEKMGEEENKVKAEMIKIETELGKLANDRDRVDYLLKRGLEKRVALLLPNVKLTKSELDGYLLMAAEKANTPLCVILMNAGASPRREHLLKVAELGYVETFQVLENSSNFTSDDLLEAYKVAVVKEQIQLAYYLHGKVKPSEKVLDELFETATSNRIQHLLEETLSVQKIDDPLATDEDLGAELMDYGGDGEEEKEELLGNVQKAFTKKKGRLGDWMRRMLTVKILDRYRYVQETDNSKNEQLQPDKKSSKAPEFEEYPPIPVNTLTYFLLNKEGIVPGATVRYSKELIGSMVIGMSITETSGPDDILAEIEIPEGMKVGFYPIDFTVILPPGTPLVIEKMTKRTYQLVEKGKHVNFEFLVAIVNIK